MENKYSEPYHPKQLGVFGRLALSAKNEIEEEDAEDRAFFAAKSVKDEVDRLMKKERQLIQGDRLAREMSMQELEAAVATERQRRRSRVVEEKEGRETACRLEREMKEEQERIEAEDKQSMEAAARLETEFMDEDMAASLAAQEKEAYNRTMNRLQAEEEESAAAAKAMQEEYQQECNALLAERQALFDADREIASKLQSELRGEEDKKALETEKSDRRDMKAIQAEDKKILRERAKIVAKAWRSVKVVSENVEGGLGMSFYLPELDESTVKVVRDPNSEITILQVRADSVLLKACELLSLPKENQTFKIDLRLDCGAKVNISIEDVSWEYSPSDSKLHIIVQNLVLRQTTGENKKRMVAGMKSRFARLSSWRSGRASSEKKSSKDDFDDV